MAGLRAGLVTLAARMRRHGRLPATAGATLLRIVPGFLIQFLLLGDARTLQAGLDTPTSRRSGDGSD
ncbi:hypothetical protein [Nonomuraea sp. NPDC003754]